MADLIKRLLSHVMAYKLYTGHPCLSSQFIEKRSDLYVHSSTFNVSVNAPCHTTRLTILIALPGKGASRAERREQSGKNTLKGTSLPLFVLLFARYCKREWGSPLVILSWGDRSENS